MLKISHTLHHHIKPTARILFWFILGGTLGLFFFTSFIFILYQQTYHDRVYPGVSVNNIDFSGKTQEQIREYFMQQNAKIAGMTIQFRYKDMIASASAQTLSIGYDADLLAQQAMSIGRSPDAVSNASILIQAYTDGVRLPASFTYTDSLLSPLIQPMIHSIDTSPVNASFSFDGSRVKAFTLSQSGKQVNTEILRQEIIQSIPLLLLSKQKAVIFVLPVDTIKPQITTESINNYGIKELIASGTSIFQGSIASRVYNIGLAASRLNGTLVPPNTIFSFDKSVGDISSLSGYKQAYIIENGHTVLGDGGGVCQVSTTLFRALLNAGVPIVEHHPHAYEVHYYTEDAPLGFDASIYSPTDDLKFKNDTGHYILIQADMDAAGQRLTFNLYGTKDGRQVSISQPVISNVSPAPPPLYQDDPNLPKGTVQQTDFAAPGATSVFTRSVTKDGKVIIADTFKSVYRPWQAVYLRGTK